MTYAKAFHKGSSSQADWDHPRQTGVRNPAVSTLSKNDEFVERSLLSVLANWL